MYIDLELCFNGVVMDEIRAYNAAEAAEILQQHSRLFDDQNGDIKTTWLALFPDQKNPVVTIKHKTQ